MDCICICIYICIRSYKPVPEQRNLTCEKEPLQNLGSAHRTLDTLLAGSVLEAGLVISFPLLSDLPFTSLFLPSFLLYFCSSYY